MSINLYKINSLLYEINLALIIDLKDWDQNINKNAASSCHTEFYCAIFTTLISID
jgi:hypothetical protein